MASRTLQGLALCAGAGGLELGLHIAEPGYRTVCYVEQEAYAAATLVARMEDQALDTAPVWDDVKTFDGRPWRGKVDIVTAGYPCQPFSTAGKQLGEKDPRHIWPDIRRIIKEIRPRYVFIENVANHLRIGFFEVAGELRRLGYRSEAGLFTAREVGASHGRQRLFCVAHADRIHVRLQSRPVRPQGRQRVLPKLKEPDAKNADQGGGAVGRGASRRRDIPLYAPGPGDLETWRALIRLDPGLQPCLRRDDDGLAYRLDRNRLVGNGVSPLAAAYAWRTLSSKV